MNLFRRRAPLARPALAPPPDAHLPRAILFPGYGGTAGGESLTTWLSGNTRLPGSDWDWQEEVKDPTLNYLVSGCLRWIADNITEPTLQVVRRQEDGELKPDASHAFLDLLADPNEAYDGDALLMAAAWDYAVTGRAFLLKQRDNLGRIAGLWWAPWWTVRPRWPAGGEQFIQDYVYRPDGHGNGVVYAREDVVHFQWGLDALTGGRLGVHRTRPALPAIAALNEGMVYTPSILRNMGIVPNVLMVKGTVSGDTKQGLRKWFTELFTRDGRGRPGVLEVEGEGATVGDIKQLGLSPEDLTLDTILNRPEIAVCMAFGIHPGVLFAAAAGGSGFDTGGQLREARRSSYHDCLIPLTKRFGKILTRSLLSEFETAPAADVCARWDFTEVEALQEDQKELFLRLNQAVTSGWMRVSEARDRARLPYDESDKVYLRRQGVTAVRTADEAPAPPPGNPPPGQEPPDAPDAPDDEEREPGREPGEDEGR